PVVSTIDSKLASQIVWLGAFITNVDRTFKNTNMLIWHKDLWLIDHGAAFYFHHTWTNWENHARSPFAFIKDHVLLSQATELQSVDAEFKTILTDDVLSNIVELIPVEWLQWKDTDETPEQIKATYLKFLMIRKDSSDLFIKEADDARKTLI
nr:aminotransferase class I and II [Bacteroidia bacterium]